SWLLAFILSPLVGLILRAFPRLPRVVVVGVVYGGLFIGLSAIILVVAGSLAASIGSFITDLPELQAKLPEILAGIQGGLNNLGFQVDLVAAAQNLFAGLGDLGNDLVRPLTDLALFSLGIVGNLLIVIFLSLFIVLDKDKILAYTNRLIPPRYGETATLFQTSVSSSFGGFIRGQAIQGLIYGLIAAGTHLAFGLEFLPASAALVGVLQTIPFFGPFLSWAPPVVVAVLTKPEVAIPTLIVMAVGWFIVMNIVQPRVMATAVGIHPIVVLVSVIIGLKVAGVAGAIFALPFAAVIAAFFHHFLSRNANLPRDVTTRAARRVGEREGRPVRVPKPPALKPDAAAQPEVEPSAVEPSA
ncbi:MAG TPA: AI-2E family transporter, partial [Candidatus Limnocylindrales bacterium]|nr:AI-2E family transporter [Candidatus Limnocylindrales bacterium]